MLSEWVSDTISQGILPFQLQIGDQRLEMKFIGSVKLSLIRALISTLLSNSPTHLRTNGTPDIKQKRQHIGTPGKMKQKAIELSPNASKRP